MYIPENHPANPAIIEGLLEEGEEAAAMLHIGFNLKVLTNQRLLFLSASDKVSEFISLAKVSDFEMTSWMGTPRLDARMRDGSKIKIGSVEKAIEFEVLDVFRAALDAQPKTLDGEQAEGKQSVSNNVIASESVNEDKRAQKEEKKRAKQEANRQKSAKELETYGREIASEALGGKFVKFYDRGYVKVGLLGSPEKILGIEGSADNLQKKSAAGRAVGAVFTMGMNVAVGSNRRGDLLVTITTDKQVHSIIHSAPYSLDLKSYQRIISVGKSLLAREQSQSRSDQAPINTDITGKLKELVELRDSGALSAEEFEKAKSKLLD